jgi:hypothetical protein
MKLFPLLTLALAGSANGIKFFTKKDINSKRGLRAANADHHTPARNLEELLPLTYIGNNGVPESAFPLGVCEADCDKDDDCEVCYIYRHIHF